jgi:hypothetical protein
MKKSENYKYLNDRIDIYNYHRQLQNPLSWKEKELEFTWHFYKEFEQFKKQREFIIEILENGEHVLISKKQKKYNVFYPYQRKYICLSYAIKNEIIPIHIKPINNKPGEKEK